jgi:hypothetical protein
VDGQVRFDTRADTLAHDTKRPVWYDAFFLQAMGLASRLPE